jgi:hypothetical protein
MVRAVLISLVAPAHAVWRREWGIVFGQIIVYFAAAESWKLFRRSRLVRLSALGMAFPLLKAWPQPPMPSETSNDKRLRMEDTIAVEA